jgi:hypothetical protein
MAVPVVDYPALPQLAADGSEQVILALAHANQAAGVAAVAETHLRAASTTGSPEAEFALTKHLISVCRACEAEQLVRSVILRQSI